MAQFYTDFSEYSTGSQPSDWTLENDGGGWTVESGSSSTYTGGQYLYKDGSYHGTFDPLLSWDEPPDNDSIELVVLIERINGVRWNLYGHDGNYWARWDTSSGENPYQIGKPGQILAMSTKSQFTWNWVRFRARNSSGIVSVKSRLWEKGASEPSTWDMEVTDSSPTSGYIGLGGAYNSELAYDVVGVGTNGDAAPTSPVSSGAPAAPTNLQLSEQ